MFAGESRGQERRNRADGHTRRSVVQRLQRDARLLERRGNDKEGDPGGRLAEIGVMARKDAEDCEITN